MALNGNITFTDNFGSEFTNNGGTININLGPGLTLNANDELEVNLTYTTETIIPCIGRINVNADGTTNHTSNPSITATRTAQGLYTMTPPAGALTAIAEVLEAHPTRDSIEIHPQSATDYIYTSLWIGEGDNGTTANTLRDRAFSVVWFGSQYDVITSLDLVTTP